MDTLQVDQPRAGVTRIVLDRPERLNAMNAALCLIDRDCKVLWQNRTFGLWFGDSFGQPGLHSFISKMRSDPAWVDQVFQRGHVEIGRVKVRFHQPGHDGAAVHDDARDVEA